jgi:hypothetical protein
MPMNNYKNINKAYLIFSHFPAAVASVLGLLSNIVSSGGKRITSKKVYQYLSNYVWGGCSGDIYQLKNTYFCPPFGGFLLI